MERKYLDQIDAAGGLASVRRNDCIPVSVEVAKLASVFINMCFCTFLVDFQQQKLFFSKGMTDTLGLAEGEGILLPDFLRYLPAQDGGETAKRYGDYFTAAVSGKAGTISFQHSLCSTDGCTLMLEVHMQVVFDGDKECIRGAVFDRTPAISELNQTLQQNIIDGSAAVVFVADIVKSQISFSENLHKILPDARLEFCGDIVGCIAEVILPEDRCRFVELIEQIISGIISTFSFEFRIYVSGIGDQWLAVRGKSFDDPIHHSKMVAGTLVNLSEMNEFKEIVEKSEGRHEVTDLPVRKKLVFDLEKVIHDRNVLSAAVVMIDIKEFHIYNDRFGRSAGDEILRGISDMITERLPSGGNLYHINIDHFCVLWPHASRVQVDNFMSFMQEETTKPIKVRNENIYVAYAMSAALFPSSGCSADELLVNAGITLNKIKKDKRRHYSIFVPSDKRELTEKLDFESQLAKSVRNTNDSFLLYYQPLVDAQGEVLIGAEALLRWISPSKDIICPERVIAALEATGHMDGVGAWVLEEAMRQCSGWLREGINPEFVLHVNITAEDLMRPNYSLSVISLLSRYCMNPCSLILEITETSLMRSVSSCRQNLIRLRKAGVRISLDDFGTGYSSMNYLRELPVDEIKIDRSFLENIQRDRYNHSFISAMIILAHSISLTVCIEGIESCGQADTVRALHADVFQGFFFGRPVSSSEFESRYLKKLQICN